MYVPSGLQAVLAFPIIVAVRRVRSAAGQRPALCVDALHAEFFLSLSFLLFSTDDLFDMHNSLVHTLSLLVFHVGMHFDHSAGRPCTVHYRCRDAGVHQVWRVRSAAGERQALGVDVPHGLPVVLCARVDDHLAKGAEEEDVMWRKLKA